jgi:hypothetical protein
MSKPRTQRGYIREENGAFHVRYYVHENGVRRQRSHRLCVKDELNATKQSPSVVALCEDFMLKINLANTFNDEAPGHNCPVCGNRCKRTIEQKFAPKL